MTFTSLGWGGGELKVLFVDDEPDFLEQAKDFLEGEEESLNIETAISAEKALDQLEKDSFDAIVSDYKLPEMDGLELFRVVKGEKDIDIPFIIFTGKGREEVAMEALNLGVDRYLQKGGDPRPQYGILADALVQEIKRKRVERKSRELAAVTEQSSAGIIIVDLEDNIQYANKAWAEMHGYDSGQELVGKPISTFHADERAEEAGARFDRLVEKGGSGRHEAEHTRVDGTTFPIAINATLLKDEQDRPYAVVGFAWEITERKKAEEELREYKSAVEASGDSIYMIDRDYRYVFANDEHLSRLAEDGRISQAVEDEVIGRKYEDIHSEEDSKILKENVDEAIQTGEPRTKTHEFSSVDRWSSRTYSPVEDPESGEIEGVVIVSKDITEKREKEEERKEAEAKFRKFFEESGDGIFITQLGGEEMGKILEVNPAATEQTGYSGDELVGMSIGEDLAVEGTHSIDLEKVDERLSRGETVKFTEKKRRKDGTEYWTEVMVTPIEYQGEVATLSINRDVTERKEREEELQRVKTAVDASNDAIGMATKEGVHFYQNDAFTRMFGYSLEEIRDQGIEITFQNSSVAEEMLDTIMGGGSWSGEVKMVTKDGRVLDVMLRADCVKDEEGNIIGLIGVHRDITERKKREEKLRKSEEKYRSLVEQSQNGIFIYRGNKLKFVNDRVCEVSGYDEEELHEMSIWDLVHPEDRERVKKIGRKRFAEGEEAPNTYEARVLTKEGDLRHLEFSVTRIDYRGKTAAQGVVRDITERKKREEKLRAYRSATESSDDSIYMVDRDYRYILANEEHLSRLSSVGHISEVDESEVVGRKIHDIFPKEVAEKFSKAIDKVFETGESQKGVSKGTRDKSWSSRTISPVEDPKTGEVEAVTIISKDITERKEIEEKEEFLHSLLRHDLGNKAQIIQGYHKLLQGFDLPEAAEEYVEKASKSVQDTKDLIKKVRTLRKVSEEEEIEEVNVGKIIKNVIDESKPQISESGIKVEHENLDFKVQGGPLLEELFSNLIENAIVHSGCENVRISGQKTEEGCVVTVEDDGKGIPDEDKDRVFERGYKKGEAGGSGLGMYLVKEIAESYGGSVRVKDSDLGGARVDVSLKEA